MAPILIDTRSFLKLGFTSLFVIVMIFSGGFLFGYEKATAIHQAGSEVSVLNLPEKVAVTHSLEAQVPAVMEAGEEIDVDHPEQKSETLSKKTTLLAGEKTASNVESPSKGNADAETRSVVVAPKGKVKIKENIKNKIVANKQLDAVINNPVIEKESNQISSVKKLENDKPVLLSAFTKDELSEINYSIQVGMYGRLINAENMMKMLQAKKLNAYVSNYSNKKDETRYNVRVGYFPDKKSAIVALKDYRNSEKGDGYLVKFSVDNIINLADTKAIVSPALIKENKVLDKPRSTPQEVMLDKVSQADFSNIGKNNKVTETNAL